MSAAAAVLDQTIVLSPHELATLMLVRSAPDQIDMTRSELATLLDCRLISLDARAGVSRRPILTPAGAHLLEAAARADRQRDDDLR
jgi:hypothetical protein